MDSDKSWTVYRDEYIEITHPEGFLFKRHLSPHPDGTSLHYYATSRRKAQKGTTLTIVLYWHGSPVMRGLRQTTLLAPRPVPPGAELVRKGTSLDLPGALE